MILESWGRACSVEIEAVKGVPHVGGDLGPSQPLDAQVLLCHAFALLPDVLALALLERCQKIVKSSAVMFTLYNREGKAGQTAQTTAIS